MASKIIDATRHQHADQRRFSSGWLLLAFPTPSQTNILIRAVTATLAILGLEYAIEVLWLDLPYWQANGPFLHAPGVIVGAIVLVLGFVLLGQWGTRYLALWTDMQPAFDVDPAEYDAVVQQSLDGLYHNDHIPFGLFVIVQVGVYTVFGHELPAGYLHVGFIHFLGVTALYNFYRHTVTIHNVTALNLIDVATARSFLAEIADFSVAVSLNWFGGLAAIVVYIGFFMGLERDVGLFYALVTLGCVIIGLLVFLIPLVLLHEALAAAKQAKLHSIHQDYDQLFREWRDGTYEGDPSVGLDILETRRRNAESLSTWPYQLLSVSKLALGSIIPTAISIAQTIKL